MSSIETPRPIVAFFDATNAADPDAFVVAFIEDAFLDDRGRQYRGHEGVRDWNRTTSVSSQHRPYRPYSRIRAGHVHQYGRGLWQRIQWHWNMTFTLRGERISSLVTG